MLSVLKPSMFFSVPHDYVTMTDVTSQLYFVTCRTIIYNVILYSLSKSKIRSRKYYDSIS